MPGSILFILAVGVAGLVVLVTLAPIVRTGYWVARVCDFPRAQIGAIAIVGVLVAIAAAAAAADPLYSWICAGVCGLVALAQGAQMIPYTRLWPQQVGPGDVDATVVRFLVANIDYENEQHTDLRQAIDATRADAVLLVEFSAPWEKALGELVERFPHRAGCVRGEGLGLTLVSRYELRNVEVRHLVSERRASIHGEMLIPGGPVSFVALHPAPPGLDEDGYTGRRDSRPRDAELVLVARAIREQPTRHWIVLGDLNDVAWSHTTRLFRRLSGLRDPRIGRKLLNTYHARYRLLDYPLDHIFLSPRLGIRRLDRVCLPGSDHFGVLADVAVPPGAPADIRDHAEADAEDHAEAAEIVCEGRQTEREERADFSSPER